jgi:hypothetical protein
MLVSHKPSSSKLYSYIFTAPAVKTTFARTHQKAMISASIWMSLSQIDRPELMDEQDQR